MKKLITLATLFLTGISMAQNARRSVPVEGQRRFTMTVREDSTGHANRQVELRSAITARERGVMDQIFSLYRKTAAGRFSSAAGNLVNFGANTLYNTLRSHRKDWMEAVKKENLYLKNLKMQTDIVDFYKEGSQQGPLDPASLAFDGFGCRQIIQLINEEGKQEEHEVFNVSCSLRDDDIGMKRIVNHTKFEVQVDSVYFDPWLCNLPNDSLTNPANRIEFDFDKRTNLTFTLTASITSSWMTEAMQIFKDQPLGEFRVTVRIRKEDLDEDGIFRYVRGKEADKNKQVVVVGESFMVPRSYVGTVDGRQYSDSAWGTGQYRVDMNVCESCQINEPYYLHPTEGQKHAQKWNKKWKHEWKKIRSRRASGAAWRDMQDIITSGWANGAWVTTIIEPISSTYIQKGNQAIAGK